MENSIRVAIVLSSSSGGLPHYTAELANHLSEEVTVRVYKPEETTADDFFNEQVQTENIFKPHGISVNNISSGNINPLKIVSSFNSYKNIREIDEFNPDIIHFTDNLFPPTQLFSWLYHRKKYPVLVTKHEVYDGSTSLSEQGYGVYASILARECLNTIIPSSQIEQYIVHTEKNKNQLEKSGINPESINIIPHGAYTIFSHSSQQDAKTDGSDVLFFGNITPAKAVDTLIASAASVDAQTDDRVNFIIAGSGDIPERAQEIIDAHPELFEVHNRFVENEEVGEFFQRADLVVIPHRHQRGHSGTLTIAFDHRKPVVTTNVGEFERLVEESGAGITVRPDDESQMADAIETILTDHSRRQRMQRSSEEMANRLSWDNVARKHICVYKEMIEDN